GLAIPFAGMNVMSLLFDGPFPGSHALWPRMYIAHVLLLPVLIGTLLVAHLVLVALRHHTEFRRRRETERRIVGVPLWPGQTPRSLGLAFAVAGVLFLLGWLIGGLRLMPGFDIVIGHYTLVPNPFWGGALFPLIVFGFLYLWPYAER